MDKISTISSHREPKLLKEYRGLINYLYKMNYYEAIYWTL